MVNRPPRDALVTPLRVGYDAPNHLFEKGSSMSQNHYRIRVRAASSPAIRTSAALVAAVSALAAVAGCGAASQTPSQSQQSANTTLGPSAALTTGSSAGSQTTGPATLPAAPAPTSAAAAKTKPPVAPPPPGMPANACQTGSVKVTASGSNSGAGTQVERFLVTNAGSSSCTMQKYPGFSIYGPMPQGGSTVEANLTLTVQPIPSGFGDIGGSGGLVTLAPGGTAAFFVKWSDVPTGSGACPTGDGFSFTTPQDSSHQALVTFAFGAVCGSTVYDSQIFPPSVTS